jgi:hypothetical protein
MLKVMAALIAVDMTRLLRKSFSLRFIIIPP